MYYNTTATKASGEAFIASKRNRLKVYPSNQIFLQDKQEFEIELFNPSGSTKLAKISINGKSISSAGIVIKPGQRIYLERYIDSPKKFLFETYVVEDTKATQAATVANGDIQVSFYDEIVATPTFDYRDSLWYQQAQQINSLNTRSLHSKRSEFGSQQTPLFEAGITTSCFRGAGGASLGEASASMDFMEQPEEKRRMSSKETGRIEQGSLSSQKFKNYQGSFSSVVSNIVNIKLLPMSAKPLEINELANFCTVCGTKNKKNSYKFCPTCGRKF